MYAVLAAVYGSAPQPVLGRYETDAFSSDERASRRAGRFRPPAQAVYNGGEDTNQCHVNSTS
jgi:hypothetical protein